MEAATALGGLASGALLTALVLAVWDGLRPVAGFRRAIQVIGWLAGTLLLSGAVLAWLDTGVFLGLLLVAALAAPQDLPRRSSWINTLPLLPPLALAGGGVFWRPAATSGGLFIALASALCAGLGARALGEGVRALAGQTPAEWPGLVTYALLTLLAGGLALANLMQRGVFWSGRVAESGLAASWLAWSAAWFVPRERARLRAGAIVIAAVLLGVVASLV